ncbi:MAG: amino acid dehydrogenase [Pseudomonadales bacterium]|jgi:leucine dehydrogenase|uniref:Glu/Leu/Phe/Val dehydrogenase family protein n=1 Tax=unclassified Ketobacter TaxID=2639109 RepID=UPI000C45B733|nr:MULTISPECIES: Glu/Leu/Phe/Val dehydrogenase family protein [unclassified Ketobacter]MAQ23034.1 amino acid dehydrogenase [Pseudomonadales bacterium]MEC8813687.1 Glu/Leu/Phe/Val dehydrogenase dimerization domain-containing protein [Pseudomonadota bacterium]TNC88111.1 MAG: amino acid dehydrogenase [Alcanivorax sp.]HAG97143.1 amino acid dehydrogenase [Gammaproteobacteria bacterium]MAQ27124.1 amino acid dehydrogenase [Pseudomonadales bacterium]|tara:strand:- start:670 stop:1707 length:1038 start_codon:yes stop_codon:yes gene_type:complete
MFDIIEQARLGELHFKSDPDSGLKSIIAIHNTKLGPALGGCRCIEYHSDTAAIMDVVRLARGMSYKAALAKVPQGGGKAVILKPAEPFDRKALYQAFGRFVNELGGRYITAIDSGTTIHDMDQVAKVTPHVSGSHSDGLDPSPNTALGVLAGMKAAALQRYGNSKLKGLTVAIQGMGNVGFHLASLLYEEGARLLVTDLQESKVKQAQTAFHAEPMSPDQFCSAHCHILSPCGLGGVINHETINVLHCDIIAGSANNQLATPDVGQQLHQRGILYAPDYVINAGGLIQVSMGLHRATQQEISNKTWGISETLYDIFTRSSVENLPPSTIADLTAEEILYQETVGA